jgi:hypothetical protein
VPRIACEGLGLGYHPHFVRSVRELPQLVNTGNQNPVVYVGLADGISPIEFTSKASAVYGLHARWTGRQMRAFVHENKLYVTNAKNLKSIYFSGIFENPRKAHIFRTGKNERDFEYPLSYSDVEYVKKRIMNVEIKMFLSVFTENVFDYKDSTIINVKEDVGNDK